MGSRDTGHTAVPPLPLFTPPIPEAVLSALHRGQTILTANQRAARALRLAYNQHLHAEGVQHWSPPSLFALETWLSSLWHQLLLNGHQSRILLNRTQEHTLWRSIIAADPEVSGLRSTDALAEMAARAWHLTCLHNAQPRLREFGVSTDTRAFQRWAQAFARLCDRKLYLSPAQLPQALESALADGHLPLPDPGLTLVDFLQPPPAHLQLFESLRQAGFAVETLQTHAPNPSVSAFCAPDESAELHAAALWIAAQLKANPAARIAVVLPALGERRSTVDSIFHQILSPATRSITAASTQAPPFEFSLGLPLADTPLCAAALDLLHWCLGPLPLRSLSNLLLSPYVGGPTRKQALAAADFDACTLRRPDGLRPELSLSSFLALLRRTNQESLAGLLRRTQAMHALAQTELLGERPSVRPSEPGSRQATYAHWADSFRKLLAASGWTSASERDSLSFQTRRRWESVLDELATLDFEGTRPTASEALHQLQRIVRETIFAPESRNAPVQILGPLELGGMPFDALWFLSADDLSWPPAAATSPLIPWSIQRHSGMPGADPQRDSERALQLTRSITSSAPQVIFSFSATTLDGTRRLSPLLNSFHPKALEPQLELVPSLPLPLDAFPDVRPIAALPAGLVRGGAGILKLQAACPFRAFAEKRLHSGALEEAEPGLDPRQQGNIIHIVMDHFWAQLNDQPSLLALSPSDRHALLDACITQALSRYGTGAQSPWDRTYLQVQKARLHALLGPWLECEANRPEFTVLDREKTLSGVTIGPLHLDVRVDRIDQTRDGTLILDYKTGGANTSDWLSERPDEPQLPLYAVLADPPPAGVAFALLRAGNALGLKGFADSSEVLDDHSNKLTVPGQIDEWRHILSALATDFAQGQASVDPKAYPKTCTFCAQRILCRLDPSTLQDPGDREDPSTSEADLV